MTRATKEQIDALYVAQGLAWGMHPIQVRDLAGDVIQKMTSEEVEAATRHAEEAARVAEAAWIRGFAEALRELSVSAKRAPAVLTVDNFYALLEQASAEEIRCDPEPTTEPPAAVGSNPSTTTPPAGGFVSLPTSPAAPAVARTPSGDALLGAGAAAKAAEPGTAAASTTGAADPRGGR